MLKAMSEKGKAELQDEKLQYAKCPDPDSARATTGVLDVFALCRSMIYIIYICIYNIDP